VARALLREPPVLFLDEPTTGLDAATSRRLLQAVARHRGGRTVIVATHDPVAIDYADRVITLDDQSADTRPIAVGAGR
jgi:ABC-type transport system involved in cytochrome bd biosynthesis fused ATPase/permease subunit